MALAPRSWECWVRQHGCARSQQDQSKQPRAPARGPRAAELLWGQCRDGHHKDTPVPGLGTALAVLGAGQDSGNPPPGLGPAVLGGVHPPCIPATVRLPFPLRCVRYGTFTDKLGKSPRCQPRHYLLAPSLLALAKG